MRSRNFLVIIGAVGYWAWDNAVLWAAFHAFGHSPPLTVILMGYLIGQLGGLLPLPGGLGGIDGGLIGTLIVYGTASRRRSPPRRSSCTESSSSGSRCSPGAVAFVSLRRGLNRPDRPDLCFVPAAT